jgi:hypothetical protein
MACVSLSALAVRKSGLAGPSELDLYSIHPPPTTTSPS